MFSKCLSSQLKLIACLTCFLSSHPSTGHIHNCEWEATVVRTLDIINASPVIPKPTAKPINVGEIIGQLKIYGIVTEKHVSDPLSHLCSIYFEV